jgi:hypothetical protein
MDSLVALHDSLPWFLQLNGSTHLQEWLADWGAQQGVIRGDDWTQLFLWIYKWLAVAAVVWGVGAGLLVTKRSPKGRFRGDPEKYRDAIFAGMLRTASGLAIAAVVVLVLFLAVAVGTGPLLWLGVVLAALRLGIRFRRRLPQPPPRPSATAG